jgi:phage-related minor tail protein
MAQTAVGDLVVNLDVNSTKFHEQLSYVKKELKQTGNAANDEALRIQQSFSRQENAARKAGISVGQYSLRCVCFRRSLLMLRRSWRRAEPWLILLQQGGQVKDSFGGIIPTFRALLGTISGDGGHWSIVRRNGALFYAWYRFFHAV